MRTDIQGDSAPREYLAFQLGDEQYGIDITRVREIRAAEPVTRLVEAPAYVKGIINLRGEIVLVSDMRTRFGMPPSGAQVKPVMIVVDAEQVIAMVVDGVTDVVALGADDIQRPDCLDGVVDDRFVKGVASVAGGMLIVLDVVPLVTSPARGERLQ